jgi:hypothetical protein
MFALVPTKAPYWYPELLIKLTFDLSKLSAKLVAYIAPPQLANELFLLKLTLELMKLIVE